MEYIPRLQPPLPSDPSHNTSTAATDHQKTLPHYQQNAYYHHLPPSIAPSPNPSTAPPHYSDIDTLKPPGVDHYGNPAASYTYGSSGYHVVVATDGQGCAAKEAIWQYGADPVVYGGIAATAHPIGLEGLVPQINPGPGVGFQGLSYGNLKKKKVPKVVQSVCCQVCKIDCNSQEVLNNHKLGKKHKKNLEKLKESMKLQPSQPPKVAVDTKAGNKTNQSKKKSGPPTDADLEIKKRKVLEGGAAQDAVKICTICNVVCNSMVVFNYHLAGQKHAAGVKKQGAVGS